MVDQVRRVVLGRGAAGRSAVCSDEPAPGVHASPSGQGVTEVWRTDVPVDLAGADSSEDPTGGPLDFAPPPGATRFWVADFPAGGVMPVVMHATPSLDYLVVLSGSVTLDLEEGSVELRAGDTAIQRGNLHAWRNEGTEPCRVAVVMIGAAPLPAAPSSA